MIWDPTDMTMIRRLPAPEWVIGVEFTPGGTRLLTAGGARKRNDGRREVQIWAASPWSMRWLDRP